jgi:hypothetical protein
MHSSHIIVQPRLYVVTLLKKLFNWNHTLWTRNDELNFDDLGSPVSYHSQKLYTATGNAEF